LRRLKELSQPKGVTVEDRDTRAFVAEFLGTFLLVLFIGFVVSLNSGTGLGLTDFAVIGLVHFFLLATLVFALGDLSGAHFNPAVTVTMTALKKIKPPDAAVYIVLQFAAAILAALVIKLILKDEGAETSYGGVAISEKFLQGDILPGLIVEAIGTFILVFGIMSAVASRKEVVSWAPLAIGAALALPVLALAPLTGAGFNPARALGPDLVGGIINDEGFGWGKFLLAYVCGPLVGGLSAGFLYEYLLGDITKPVSKLP
jgi:glycerol uptake facilitator protein